MGKSRTTAIVLIKWKRPLANQRRLFH